MPRETVLQFNHDNIRYNYFQRICPFADSFSSGDVSLSVYISILVEPARKGEGKKIGNFTLSVLGSPDHLYIFRFAGNGHVFEAYIGESYYGI